MLVGVTCMVLMGKKINERNITFGIMWYWICILILALNICLTSELLLNDSSVFPQWKDGIGDMFPEVV